MTDLTPERLDLIRSSCRRSVATSDKYPLITMDAADVLALLAAVAERDALAAKLDAVRALADLIDRHTEFESDPVDFRDASHGGSWDDVADRIRAMLDATPETGGES